MHINCDMGEGFGRYQIADDAALMPYIDACNIACGFHAGDPNTIRKTIELAIAHGVDCGAHPSYPDRQGFGRRKMDISKPELQAMVTYQIAAVAGMATSLGTKINHVKPHGALYNEAAKNEAVAVAIVDAILSISSELVLYAPPKSVIASIAGYKHLAVQFEAFADRTYMIDGSLSSRKVEGAIIHDPIQASRQVNNMLTHQLVSTLDGNEISITADTFCVHGDHPNALAILKELRSVNQDG